MSLLITLTIFIPFYYTKLYDCFVKDHSVKMTFFFHEEIYSQLIFFFAYPHIHIITKCIHLHDTKSHPSSISLTKKKNYTMNSK